MFTRLSFFEMVGLYFTSVIKLLPMAKSSFAGCEVLFPGVAKLAIKLIYEGLFKPETLPGERDIYA